MRVLITRGVILAVLLSLIDKGLAKFCYQCDSTLDSNCQEMWDHNLAINQQKYKECDLWGAGYCVKVTGMWGGVVGTHRFCSSRDMGDQCQDIWFPDHDRLYRACVYTCSDDGCNSASYLRTSTSGLWMGLLLSVAIVVLRFL
ncbi:uncharacterized protein PoB_006493100 [Plakobranchus ocellatus]|uniref:Protein sleepless n=1 Tax=Plakobranchus ocellatus TaxID=259542 RepID=A0AAV4D2L6_9GAST|nr:uncharacterized protein PoB_006493100 [Plakobranchus ocellatus]